MYIDDNKLVKKLLYIVLFKIVVVYALWWVFIKDHRVAIDTDQHIEQHFLR